MKIGTILAVLQSVGTVPVSRDAWYIRVSAGAMMSATSLRSRGEIESSPAAVCILSYESSLWTPLKDMLMSGIDGVELCPRSGKLLSSCVYADLNGVLSISALLLLSLYIKPSLPLRDRPFNLKGGLRFFVSFRIFFSDNTRVRIFFFVAQSANFFSRI